MKHEIRTLQTLWQLNRVSILIWGLLQISFILVFRNLTHAESETFATVKAETIYVWFLFVLTLSYGWLIGLGITFNVKQRENWLRQLPLPDRTFTVTPIILIFIYGVLIQFLLPWGPYVSELPLYTLLMPILGFLILKNLPYVRGIILSMIAVIVYLVVWHFLFSHWSINQSTVVAHGVTFLVFSVVLLLFFRRESRYLLVVPIGLTALLLTESVFHTFRKAGNFREALADLTFVETEKTVAAFRTLALDKEIWRSVDQYSIPRFLRYKSQIFANQHLTSQEKIQFIENVHRNVDLWKEARLSSRRPGMWSFYPQPAPLTDGTSEFPVSHSNVDEEIESYLYANWKQSAVFCELLPFRKEKQYLDKIFLSDCGRSVSRLSAVLTAYNILEYGEFEKLLDQYLLSAHDEADSNTRASLVWAIRYAWHLGDTTQAPDPSLFTQRPLSPETLSQLKAAYRLRVDQSLRPLLGLSRDQFVKVIRHLNLPSHSRVQSDAINPMILGQLTFGNMYELAGRRQSRRLSLAEAWSEKWQSVLQTRRFDEQGLWLFWITQEILNDAYWERLQKALALAKASE